MKLLKLVLVIASFSTPMLAGASVKSKCDAPPFYNTKTGKPLEAVNKPAPTANKTVRATAT